MFHSYHQTEKTYTSQRFAYLHFVTRTKLLLEHRNRHQVVADVQFDACEVLFSLLPFSHVGQKVCPCLVVVPHEDLLHAAERAVGGNAWRLASEMHESPVDPQVTVLREHSVHVVGLLVADKYRHAEVFAGIDSFQADESIIDVGGSGYLTCSESNKVCDQHKNVKPSHAYASS